MNRISIMFDNLKKKKQKGLFPFIVGGYPDIKTTENLLYALEDAGADLIEIGVPFSDPVADGPVIQEASYHSLLQGITLENIFAMVKKARKRLKIPVVLMSYYNPLLQFGFKRVIKYAMESGVDGFIVPDLPIEAADSFKNLLKKKNIDMILLMSINTPKNRIREIAKESTGFLYLVSHLGVTGSASFSLNPIKKKIAQIRQYSNIPVAIGFGISDAKQARLISPAGDAIIIGSSQVKMMKNKKHKVLINDAKTFISKIKKAIL